MFFLYELNKKRQIMVYPRQSSIFLRNVWHDVAGKPMSIVSDYAEAFQSVFVQQKLHILYRNTSGKYVVKCLNGAKISEDLVLPEESKAPTLTIHQGQAVVLYQNASGKTNKKIPSPGNCGTGNGTENPFYFLL